MVNYSLREQVRQSAEKLGIHMPEREPEVDPDNPYRMADNRLMQQFIRRRGQFSRLGIGLSNIGAPRFADQQFGYRKRGR